MMTVITIFLVTVPVIFPLTVLYMYANLCKFDRYGKNVPVIQSAIYCFGCEEKGAGKGTLKKFLASNGGLLERGA